MRTGLLIGNESARDFITLYLSAMRMPRCRPTKLHPGPDAILEPRFADS